MSKPSLFSNSVPLTKEQHGEMSIETGTGYDFAQKMSVVPVLARELHRAVFEYPIAFMQQGENVAAVALLGLQEDQNLFVSDDGSWSVDYVPALLRHYPFAVALGKEGDKGILCLSMDHPGLNSKGKGVALFEKEGGLSTFTKQVQKAIGDAAVEARKTEAFCAKLEEFGLLKPIGATLKNKSGKEWRISGILAVDRSALAGLALDRLDTLHKSGYLELIYQHLLSLHNLRGLAEMASEIE